MIDIYRCHVGTAVILTSKEIKAVVYPLSDENISRLINGKTTFVKFLSREAVPKVLRSGMTVLFYETGKKKAITAKGVINSVSSELPKDILNKYSTTLFLNKDEFSNYVGRRNNKCMLVIQVSDAQKLERPVNPPKTISLSGFYLNKEEYQSLFGHI